MADWGLIYGTDAQKEREDKMTRQPLPQHLDGSGLVKSWDSQSYTCFHDKNMIMCGICAPMATQFYKEWYETHNSSLPAPTPIFQGMLNPQTIETPIPASINEGWEERYKPIRDTHHNPIPVGFLAHMVADGTLSMDEANRSRWKIKLLEPFVTRMIVNMIKGSLKYTSDDWSDEVWEDMGKDDKADGINYDLLWQDKLRKEGKI